MIFKFKYFGISGDLLEVIKNFLSNRFQRVVLNMATFFTHGTRFFCALSNMFAYTIVYFTFHAPQIVVCGTMAANVYLAVHLPER